MSQTHSIRTILSLATTALFFVISAVLVILFVPGTVRPLSVQTGSMEPSLSPGHLVFVKKEPVANYQVGDVITFVNPSNRQQTITHRIAERSIKGENGVFVTKGDANAVADQPISEMLIVGKVMGSVPMLGHVIDFMHSWVGLILLIYIPALLIVGAEMRKLIAYYRSIKPYQLYEPRPKPVGPMPLLGALAGGLVLVGMAAATGTALAVSTTASAALTGNTLSMQYVALPDPEPPVQPPVTCTNDTQVNINSRNRQRAQSGDARNDHGTNGGNAQSGNASNSSSTNINVDIRNSCPVPAQ